MARNVKSAMDTGNAMSDFKSSYNDHLGLFTDIASNADAWFKILKPGEKDGLLGYLTKSSELLGQIGSMVGPLGGAISIFCGLLTGFEDSAELKGIKEIQSTLSDM